MSGKKKTTNLVIDPALLHSDKLIGLQAKIDNRGVMIPEPVNDLVKSFTDKEVAELVRSYNGNLTEVAKVMRMTRSELIKRKNRSKEIKLAIEDMKQAKVDMAEASMMDAVAMGNFNATKFVLSTLGADRGYVEKKEVKHDGVIHLGLDKGDMSL